MSEDRTKTIPLDWQSAGDYSEEGCNTISLKKVHWKGMERLYYLRKYASKQASAQPATSTRGHSHRKQGMAHKWKRKTRGIWLDVVHAEKSRQNH